MPTWIRSSISTLAGSLAIIWWARRRTSPLYCFSVVFRSSWPLAVYMAAPEIMRTRGRWRPWVARSDAPAGPSARRRGDAPGARRVRRGAQHHVEHRQAGALGQELHRRVGVGDAVGPVLGKDDGARRLGRGRAAATLREEATELRRAACRSASSIRPARPRA